MTRYSFFIYMYLSFALFATTAKTEEHSHEHSGMPVKCGTPLILENIFLGTAKIALRSTMDTSAVSSQKHFRVHYDTTGFHAIDMTDEHGNGIPDYVDSTFVYLEYAWDLQINQLGYPIPLSDNGKGGGDEIDVYLKELNNVYGQATPDNYIGTSVSSYIEIENDFSENIYATKGYDALRITTAHEFFHVIQFSNYYNWDLLWWMEQTAVWMEDKAWDDVNDYLYYLHLFFNNKETPLDSNTGNFMYGAAIWAHYLAKKFGDDIIKDIWKHLSEIQTSDIASFDDVVPIGLSEAFGEFAVWNYFTQDHANTIYFYPDSDLFPVSIETDLSANKSPAQDTLSTEYLTSRYVELLFVGEWSNNDTLRVKVTPLDGGSYVHSLIFFNDPNNYRIHSVSQSGEDIQLGGIWEKAIIVTSCTNTSGDNYNYAFETKILDGEDEHPPYAFSVQSTFPNPFNTSTNISFTLPESGNVSIRAFDVLGQKVDVIFEGRLDAGEKLIVWKPSNLSGGVYLIEMTSPWGSKVLKTMFLK